jgi:hypothetical protein
MGLLLWAWCRRQVYARATGFVDTFGSFKWTSWSRQNTRRNYKRSISKLISIFIVHFTFEFQIFRQIFTDVSRIRAVSCESLANFD